MKLFSKKKPQDPQQLLREADTGGATPLGNGRPAKSDAAPGGGMDTPRSALATGNTTGDVRSGESVTDDPGAVELRDDEGELYNIPERIMSRDPGPERDDLEPEPLTGTGTG